MTKFTEALWACSYKYWCLAIFNQFKVAFLKVLYWKNIGFDEISLIKGSHFCTYWFYF